MPLDKFVLMLVIVVAAAGATVWIASLAIASLQMPGLSLAALIPAGLVAFVVWRVISDRLKNSEDDHYDHFEK